MDSQTKRYVEAFGDPSSETGIYRKDSRLAKAYEVALDIRKFEIDLYWKRSGSFWVLVGAIAAAIGLLLSGKTDGNGTSLLSQRSKELACCLLCFSGAAICYAWGLVNKGSKFWQRNWEYQVGVLEQEVVGPLYKTVMSSANDKIMYSVSEINGYISSYFFYVFLFAACSFLIGQDGEDFLINSITYSINFGLLSFLVKLIIASMHVWFILKIKRDSGHRREPNRSFDSQVEVSVRRVSIVGDIFGTAKAEEMWKSPIKTSEISENGKEKTSFFAAVFKRSKSEKD